MQDKRILFLCSKNKLRSPTAEAIFCNVEGWHVASAGISKDAQVRVSLEDMEWADVIFVMENGHKRKLKALFGAAINEQRLVSLDIPDDYEFMDTSLIMLLQEKVPRLV
ncbi:MAG: low molecular weight protein tyrosine phosphatase family protein [Granulosicoccaceae bacterium]